MSSMGKIRVEELAEQMGIGSKEVLFLLQSIGVDVKSPQAALDESTVLAILQGKTHAPKQLIVRDSESKAFRPQKSALSRIKIVEKTAPARLEPDVEPVVRRPGPATVSTPPPGGPGMRPAGAPLRPTGPAGRPGPGVGLGRTAPPPPLPDRAPAKRKKEDEKETKKPAAKRGAKPKITVADEVDLREFVGAYEEDTYSDITLPLIEKGEGAEEAEVVAEAKPVSKSALRRAAKSTRAHDSGKLLEFKKPMPTGPIFLSEGVTIKELSEKLGVLAKDIQRLLMQRGILA